MKLQNPEQRTRNEASANCNNNELSIGDPERLLVPTNGAGALGDVKIKEWRESLKAIVRPCDKIVRGDDLLVRDVVVVELPSSDRPG